MNQKTSVSWKNLDKILIDQFLINGSVTRIRWNRERLISHLFLAADWGLASSRIQFSGCLSFDFSADQMWWVVKTSFSDNTQKLFCSVGQKAFSVFLIQFSGCLSFDFSSDELWELFFSTQNLCLKSESRRITFDTKIILGRTWKV